MLFQSHQLSNRDLRDQIERAAGECACPPTHRDVNLSVPRPTFTRGTPVVASPMRPRKGKPVARRGRKAMGLRCSLARGRQAAEGPDGTPTSRLVDPGGASRPGFFTRRLPPPGVSAYINRWILRPGGGGGDGSTDR